MGVVPGVGGENKKKEKKIYKYKRVPDHTIYSLMNYPVIELRGGLLDVFFKSYTNHSNAAIE
jgi:hypothetical protein